MRFCKTLYFHLFLITLVFRSILDVSQMISGITVTLYQEVSLYKRKQVLFITLCAGPFKAEACKTIHDPLQSFDAVLALYYLTPNISVLYEYICLEMQNVWRGIKQ